MNGSRRQCMQGFTLVELLVALTIMSILMVLLFAGFRFSTKVEERVDATLSRVGDIAGAQRLIRKLVNQSEDLIIRDNQGKLVHTFNGSPQSFSLISSLPDNEGHGGLYKFTFSINANRDDSKLTVSVRPYLSWDDWFDEEVSDSAVLYQGFALAEFAYLNLEKSGRTHWQSSWADDESVPLAIRITMKEEDGHRIGWPEQVALLKTGSYSAAEVMRR